jgi:hypothetical protein
MFVSVCSHALHSPQAPWATSDGDGRADTSRLGREGTSASVASSGIRLAKVVRSTEPAAVVAPSGRGAIIIEMHDARVRVLVEAGVDRATLSTVLELVGKGGGR